MINKFLLPTLLIIASTWTAGRLEAQESVITEHSKFTDKLIQGLSWKDGKEDLNSMYKAVVGLSDYRFDSDLTARKKNSVSKNGGRFFFKQKNRLRIEVKSSGRNNGAVVVKKDDGQIKGAGGGVLKFIKMNLEKDSRMLILPNGLNVVESDFKTLISRLKSKVAKGSSVQVTTGTVPAYKWSGPVKIIDVKSGNQLTDRILINPNMKVPVEWDIYREGQLFSIALFQNFKPNVGLKDDLFEL